MDDFATLKIKKSVADDFREYTKKITKNQSDTLALFLEYFKSNDVSDYTNVEANLASVERKLVSRFDGVIAIIRNIEKDDIKRGNTLKKMIYDLTNNTIFLESQKATTELPKDASGTDEKQEIINYKKEVHNLRDELIIFLDKIDKTKPNFGGTFYRVETDQTEIIGLKRKLKML